MELEPEVRDWFERLNSVQLATAAFYVDLLAEQGPLLGEPYTRQLDGKLRELRFHLGGRRCGDVLDRLRTAGRAADGVRQDADARGPGGGPGAASAREVHC